MIAVLILSATPAFAHVPPVAGKLVDCIERSNLIVAATVERVVDIDALTVEATAQVARTFVGDVPGEKVTFRGAARFAIGQRYMVFLRRAGTTLTGVQPAGVYFPSAPTDDELYAHVINGVRAALRDQQENRIDQLRSALISALRAGPRELRVNAALELGALAHHGVLSDEHQRALAAVAADPGIDPTVRQMLDVVLRR